MSILDRVRSMIGLGHSTGNLSDATMRRAIRKDDSARLELHGDISQTTKNVRSFSSDLDQRAREVG